MSYRTPALLAAAALLGGVGPAGALTLPEIADMAPHRAVYEITLDDAKPSAGVSDVRGRLVFEFTGSACEGYTQDLRFVMNITNQEGNTTVSDLRTSTWEQADGSEFRFDIENLENQRTSDRTTGTARHASGGDVKIDLTKPAPVTLTFPGPVYFPLQHTAELIAAAKRGEFHVEAKVFDGSDLGQKVFETAAAIGKAGPGDPTELEGIVNAESLREQVSWPMTVAYYNAGAGLGEGTPEHEMSFRVYRNGVIRSVTLDYGTLRLDGRLSQIEFLKPKPCSG